MACVKPRSGHPIIFGHHPVNRWPRGFRADSLEPGDHRRIADERPTAKGKHIVLWEPTRPRFWWVVDKVETNDEGSLDYVRVCRCTTEVEARRAFLNAE
jgi:hypothetical protein